MIFSLCEMKWYRYFKVIPTTTVNLFAGRNKEKINRIIIIYNYFPICGAMVKMCYECDTLSSTKVFRGQQSMPKGSMFLKENNKKVSHTTYPLQVQVDRKSAQIC